MKKPRCSEITDVSSMNGENRFKKKQQWLGVC